MARDEALSSTDQGWVPPAEIDGFRVIRQLGRGGMGTVYLGHDDVLDRPVALKFLAASVPRTSARDRFLIEARAIARLQHPNVVGIYRVGAVGDRPYLAYELVAGKSLDEIDRPVPWPRALDLVVGVARGLSAAHRRDVLHRDIKPANVMLADSGEIKLLDFGLAKLLDGSAPREGSEHAAPPSRDARDAALMATLEAGATPPSDLAATRDLTESRDEGSLTATGAILGTPLYMAPELWRGETATAQSDIYALGLLLYELLSGRLPHEGLRAAELAEAVLSRDPTPIRTLCPSVPQALADVVDRAIRRRREERYQTAEEARDALEAIRSLYQPFGAQHAELPVTGADDAMQISASFARIAPRADDFCARVYERLFTDHPELRPLFPADMTAQRRKLFGALVATVDNLRRPERLIPLLEDLGRRHAAYGVRPEHFDAVGTALLGAIGDFDDRARDRTRAAWKIAYDRIAQAMQRGLAAERATVPPGTLEAVSLAVRETPPIRYARNGEVSLAYQVVGTGSIDVALVTGWLTNLEIGWQYLPLARFLRGLATVGRLIVLDARGTGLSDAGPPGALLEDRTADLRAVLDAAGVERAALVGLGEGAAVSALFAATHPERTRALVTFGGNARPTAGDGYPHGASPEQQDQVLSQIRSSWGDPLFVETFAPSLARDDAFRAFWARYLRLSAAPGAAAAHHRANAAIDVRAVLPSIRVPALVLHRAGDRAAPVEASRYLAEHIPGARLVELPGEDHLPFAGDGAAMIDEVRRFLAHAPRPANTTWLLAAVVSLAGAPEAEDALQLVCERETARFRGIELDGPGQGRAAAMFDGPARAVRFARAVLARARALGITLGAGVSFDVCRLGEADVDGTAVRVAPLIAAKAGPWEILVSEGTRALLGGAMKLEERGVVEGEGLRVFAVKTEGA